MRNSLAAMALSLLLCGCLAHQPRPGFMDSEHPRQAWLVGPEGAAIGQATFTEAPRGVMIHIELADGALSPGWHGAHLHGVGDCSDRASGFQASGAHVGHGEEYIEHGFMSPWPNERGDLPNIFASASGAAGAEFFVPNATLATRGFKRKERYSLLDEDGTALVIHASPDDQRTQPIGGAGARVACAAITRLP